MELFLSLTKRGLRSCSQPYARNGDKSFTQREKEGGQGGKDSGLFEQVAKDRHPAGIKGFNF